MPAQQDKKDPLISVLGCEVRAKLVRVFSLNKDAIYIAKDFVKTLRKRDALVRGVLRNLERDGIVKKKKIPAAERRSKNLRESVGYGYNKRYPHRVFLDTIVEASMPTEQEVLAKKITQVPGVQCVVTTDVYVDRPDTVADIIIASSEDNEENLKELIRDAEKTIGRELRCIFLTINELLYRAQTNDRFIRDTLDSSHQVHVDKTGVFVGEEVSV